MLGDPPAIPDAGKRWLRGAEEALRGSASLSSGVLAADLQPAVRLQPCETPVEVTGADVILLAELAVELGGAHLAATQLADDPEVCRVLQQL